MAGFNNYEPGKGPPPIAGVYIVPLVGEVKQPGVEYPEVRSCPEIREAICEKLRSGNSLNQISTLVGFPSRRTINRWLKEKPEFRADADSARADGEDVIAEWIERKACEPNICEKVKLNGAGEIIEVIKYDNVDRSRLAVMAGQWTLAKNSRKYGDKVQLNHANEDGGPLKLIVERIEVVGAADQNKTSA